MRVAFVKMNGAGNDFILVDNRERRLSLDRERIQALCDRRRGIGADGVISIERSTRADFEMRYYNSDGGEAEMCGNGARCAAMYAGRLGLGERREGVVSLRFVTGAGPMEAEVQGGRASVRMGDAREMRPALSLSVANGEEIVHFVNTGVPHAVVVVSDVAAMGEDEVIERGRVIRAHPAFAPEGANADFVSLDDDGAVAIRTYERGVESETLACGTGAVAAAVVMAAVEGLGSPVPVRTRGAELLTVTFVPEPWGARGVVLEGPAAVSFEGTVDLSRKE